ncbi:MAG: hypothetical protein Devi2KO_15080 [Devosia indica]
MPMSWIARGAASAERSRRLMQLRGVTPNGHPLWTPWEVGPVVELAPAYGLIFPMVERRTRPGVYSKAQRLGVARKAALPWSENEILRLRKVYPRGTKEEVLAAFPGRSYSAVAKAANARGIFRSRPEVHQTGFRLLDQVLSRAQGMNLTLADLDGLARSGRYFRRHGWATKVDERIHYRIARTLGGTLRADFK